MVNYLKMRFLHVFEYLRLNGIRKILSELFFFRREAILVEKNLKDVEDFAVFVKEGDIEFFELTPELLNSQTYEFAFKNRKLKATHYQNKGFAGHGIAIGRQIIGDVWYCPGDLKYDGKMHRDIKLLGMKWSNGCVYSFDIFMAPSGRGGNLSAALQRYSMVSLRDKGHSKAVAYYWADNYPAIWNTRVLNKWDVVGKSHISRILGLWF